jgi:translation initiation factor 1
MPQTTSKTVWSSEDGDLRKKQPPPASPKSDTEGMENIKNSHVGFGGGAQRAEGVPQQQTIYLHRESKGRGGKGVTLVKGLVLSEGDLSALAKKLKQTCGSGGTVKDGVIEIQGEQRENIADALRKLGYKVKVAGG